MKKIFINKIDKYVEKYHKEKKRKPKRKNNDAVSCPRNDDSFITSPNIAKPKLEGFKSSVPSGIAQQSQGAYRMSRVSKRTPQPSNQQMHSTDARRDNGLEGELNMDKDSGESSQKVLKLDFNKLKAGNDVVPLERITMKNVK